MSGVFKKLADLHQMLFLRRQVLLLGQWGLKRNQGLDGEHRYVYMDVSITIGMVKHNGVLRCRGTL